MQKFTIELKETLRRTIETTANSLNEAISQVNEQYQKGEIVLDYDDYETTDIDLSPNDETVSQLLETELFKDFTSDQSLHALCDNNLNLVLFVFGSYAQAQKDYNDKIQSL